MPTYIIKIENYYLEWSTIVDAPISYGASLEEFRQYYQGKYGSEGMLDERLKRVEKSGCSAYHYDLDTLISCNRAGKDETCLTKEQIYQSYCLREMDPPIGTDPLEDLEAL